MLVLLILQRFSISDGQYATVFLDGNGLVVKQNGGQNYSVGTINPNTLEPVGFNNVKVYIGKDANMNGIGYFDGYINANSGGNVAGWKLSTNKLIAPNNTTYLSSDGDYAFYTEQNGTYAGIQHNGTIVGNNVNITGGSLTIGDNFRVTNNGNLTASNASVNGTITTNNITATGGKIGGWDIGSTTISQTHGNYRVILANYDNDNASSRILHCQVNGTDTFYVHRDGKLYCSNVDIKGSINSSTISGSTIKCGSHLTISNDGKFQYYNDPGFLYCGGNTTNHPYVSALNVAKGEGGISFRDAGDRTSAGKQVANIYQDGTNLRLQCTGAMWLEPKGNLNLQPTGGNIGIVGSSYVKVQNMYHVNSSIRFSANNTSVSRLTSGGTSIYLVPASSGYAYVTKNGVDYRIMTTGGDYSSRSIKKNLKDMQPKYKHFRRIKTNTNV